MLKFVQSCAPSILRYVKVIEFAKIISDLSSFSMLCQKFRIMLKLCRSYSKLPKLSSSDELCKSCEGCQSYVKVIKLCWVMPKLWSSAKVIELYQIILIYKIMPNSCQSLKSLPIYAKVMGLCWNHSKVMKLWWVMPKLCQSYWVVPSCTKVTKLC